MDKYIMFDIYDFCRQEGSCPGDKACAWREGDEGFESQGASFWFVDNTRGMKTHVQEERTSCLPSEENHNHISAVSCRRG